MLEGSPELRTPDGWVLYRAICSFPRGERGAHQLVNRSAQSVRFMALSTHGDPDIVLYPDSGKLGASERLPEGGGLKTMFRMEDAVDYWDGDSSHPASSSRGLAESDSGTVGDVSR